MHPIHAHPATMDERGQGSGGIHRPVTPIYSDSRGWNHADATTGDHRENVRISAIGIRTIRLRLIDQEANAASPWHVADILNISPGGLCLMVGALEPVTRGQALELDLRSHPDFGSLTLISELRWCHGFGSFTTLGIAFSSPLDRIPKLELERRSIRRDEHG